MSVLFASLLLALALPPRVANVTLDTHNARQVVIAYDLVDADAVVTAEVLTNGVPIGATALRSVNGDVNALVTAGTGRRIAWNARADWPGHDLSAPVVTARVTAWRKGAPPDYMVLGLADGTRRFYVSAEALPDGLGGDLYRTSKMLFRRVPSAGVTAVIGSSGAERAATGLFAGAHDALLGCETPHDVTFAKDYYLGVFEVTQSQWRHVCGSLARTQAATDAAGTFPVQACARADGEAFCAALGVRAQAEGYALPTEAQWEFACRAGTGAAFGDGRAYVSGVDVSDIACADASQPERVGSRLPNGWGFYDMHGNVCEWCADGAMTRAATTNALGVVDDTLGAYAQDAVDPLGRGEKGVLRGGGWTSEARTLRAAFRQCAVPEAAEAEFGFRVACDASAW